MNVVTQTKSDADCIGGAAALLALLDWMAANEAINASLLASPRGSLDGLSVEDS